MHRLALRRLALVALASALLLAFTGCDTAPQCWYYADQDQDGFGSATRCKAAPCGSPPRQFVDNGYDCDDTDPSVHPFADEISCDGVDNDCDLIAENHKDDLTPYFIDADLDGYGDDRYPLRACPGDVQPGMVMESGDCRDEDASINPGATEVCDGKDNDCSGGVDDGAIDALTYYVDGDGDGYGAKERKVCTAGPGLARVGGDCDDRNTGIHPDADEVCDNADNDCNGQVDDNPENGRTVYIDSDGDGHGDPAQPRKHCGPFPVPNLSAFSDDCLDTDRSVHPGAVEICDGKDNDCDGRIDLEAVDAKMVYRDADGDGYGDEYASLRACGVPDGYVDVPGDCDDSDQASYPEGEERCDRRDNNCDGAIDENPPRDGHGYYPDHDRDGYGELGSKELLRSCNPVEQDGLAESADDCDDSDPNTYPGATEVSDAADNNCDGSFDEGSEYRW